MTSQVKDSSVFQILQRPEVDRKLTKILKYERVIREAL